MKKRWTSPHSKNLQVSSAQTIGGYDGCLQGGFVAIMGYGLSYDATSGRHQKEDRPNHPGFGVSWGAKA
jgi:hypothetical protein